MKNKPLPDIDWRSLLRRLTARAVNLFVSQGLSGKEGVLKGLGDSPEDFAKNALAELFGSIHKYDADTEGKCFALANKILKQRFIDAVSKAHAHTKSVEVGDEGLPDLPDAEEPPSREVEIWDVAKGLYKYAEGDSELKDVIDAAALVAIEQTAPVQHSDIAAVLNISVKEVRKRLARLRDRYAKRSVERKTASSRL